MAVRVGMVSLGCTKNQVDAERMLYNIREAGYQLVSDAALADIAVINTCGFIESAKQEAIDTILEFAALKKESGKRAWRPALRVSLHWMIMAAVTTAR